MYAIQFRAQRNPNKCCLLHFADGLLSDFESLFFPLFLRQKKGCFCLNKLRFVYIEGMLLNPARQGMKCQKFVNGTTFMKRNCVKCSEDILLLVMQCRLNNLIDKRDVIASKTSTNYQSCICVLDREQKR